MGGERSEVFEGCNDGAERLPRQALLSVQPKLGAGKPGVLVHLSWPLAAPGL